MARTTIDFTGSNGAAWPSPFVQKTSSSGSSASIQSNRGRIVLPNLGDYGAIHAMGFTPDSNNYTISVDFVVLQTTTEQYQRVTWRNVADGSDGRCYVFEWGIDPSNASFISLYSQDSSWQQTNLYGTGYTVAVNDVIHLKVQQVGTTLRAKHWKNSENEPGTWADYNGTPGTSYTTGPVWLVAQGGATAPGTTRNKDFDNFVIETAIIPLAPANIAASAIPLTVAAPPSAVTLVPQTLALSPGILTVSAPAGGVSVTLEPQILRLLTPGSILVNDAGDPIVDDGGDPLIITGGMTISLEGEPVEQFISLSPITLTSTAVVLTTTGGSIAIALSPLTITLTLAPIGPATAGSPQSLDLAPNVLTLLLPQLEIPITGGPPEPPVAAGAFGMPTVYTTSIPPQFLQDIIFGPIVRRRRRVDIYLDDGETLWFKDAPLIDGNVSVDMSRAERRNVDLVLDNSNRYLDHHPDGFWYDNVLKVYHGVETDDAIWETQIGEFMIDSISEPHFPYQVSVRGRDYAKKLLLDEFATATAFDKGQEVAQVVRTIAENGGIRPDRMILDDDGATLGIVTTFERKTKRWEAIGKIADAHSLEVFFDRFGYLVLRPYRDPQISPLVFTFLTGATGNLANYDKESNDAWLKNHVVVSGAATGNSIPVFAEATNTNPASATSVDRIGRRTFTEESAFITTVAQAKARADQLLAVSGLESYNIDLGAIVAPWLEEGNAIEFIDPRPVMAQPTRYLLTSFDIPLQLGTMNVKGKRLTIVTSTGSERKPPGYGVTYPPTVNPPTPGVENVAPIVTQEPTNTAVQSGSMFYFTAAASGEPAPTVQWQVSTESTSGPWNDIPGATSTTLSGVASDAANGNYYRARFLNIVGSALTNAVQLTVTTVSVPTTIGRARLAWYHFDYNNPPSDAVINAWAPQIALAVLHPRMTATRNKIKAANPNCRVLAAKSLWTVVSSETTAPFSTAVSYSQAQTNSWIAQDNTP